MIPDMRRLMNLMEAVALEHWRVVTLHGIETNIGWQLCKEAENQVNHHMSLAEAIGVLAGDPITTMKTERGQERGELTGPNQSGDFLFCVVEWVETGEQRPAIRIISVRPAEPKERTRFMRIRGLTGVPSASLDENASVGPTAPGGNAEEEVSAIASDAPVQSFKDWFLRRVAAMQTPAAE